MGSEKTGFRITVTGLVQGVGFRPMVAELAEECGLLGQVKNLGGVVEIIAFGERGAVEKFLDRLNVISGKLSEDTDGKDHVNTDTGYQVGRIDTMEVEVLEPDNSGIKDKMILWHDNGHRYSISREKFRIAESADTREQKRFLPVDFPTCDRCKRELFDPKNRRYRYPFISCTQCGPRYSIQKAVPYDRDSITMDIFEMCPKCREEYTTKGNIRRHAQTIACHDCGPKLTLVRVEDVLSEDGDMVYANGKQNRGSEILTETVHAIFSGKIAALKDIGGFHFAFSPMNSDAAKRLRKFKNRDKKPFAVMFFDLDELKEYCEVSPKEEALLISQARPIVLLKKKKDFVPEICGDSDRIGAMLPCNPLQLLILKETGPLVMTSGNRGGEPIIINDQEMEGLMKQGCPDLMITHDREILTPLDDSIYQVNGEYVQLIRRARGLVPEPVIIKGHLQQDTFAAGGDLKAVFALGRDNLVYLSQYFGDLEDVRCTKRREEAIIRMKGLLEIEPKVTVGDLHPSYVSAQNTQRKVQHHHAHVASVIAEHGLEGKVLGIACDGTGFGTDGTIWGSELFLFADGLSAGNETAQVSYPNAIVTRAGTLSKVKLLGGDAGAKDADKVLFSYIMEACERGFISEESLPYDVRRMAWKQNINTAYSSSMGRLFDAVAALLNICHYNSYEGECAILLEQAAHKGKAWCKKNPKMCPEELLSMSIHKEQGMWLADSVKLVVDLKNLYERQDVERDILAYLFHHAVANALITMTGQICNENDIKQVALSGGSFINRILLRETAAGLQQAGLEVYTNEKVPCGDGGIALGQMYLMSK